LKEDVLSILKSNPGIYVSGQHLSNKLNVSRTSIWKYINSLKEEGYLIESAPKKGYMLIFSPDLLTSDEIAEFMKTKYIGKEIIHFDTIGSTNDAAKDSASKGANDGTVIISEEQTSGKGRLGRQWIAPKHKGIWMSIILKPEIGPVHVPKITHISAAAVVSALKEFNIEASIKWPNDIIINNKKICGILTEMSGEIGRVAYVVVGIGINANLESSDIPEDISGKASSIYMETAKIIDRKSLAAAVLNNFEILYEKFIETGSIQDSIKICKENSILLGKSIRIIQGPKELTAKAVDIGNDGELIVEFKDGRRESIISGEISIRGLDGYI
jgi:BirA family biotin operon repressor/biotin-[acetyl-CoA-carboxylase] ligase